MEEWVVHGDLRSFFIGVSIYNISQFLLTVIPMPYPRWMGGGNAGYPSDGLQILQLLREDGVEKQEKFEE